MGKKKMRKTMQFIREQNAKFDASFAQREEADARAVERMRPLYEKLEQQTFFDLGLSVEEESEIKKVRKEASAERRRLRVEAEKSMARLVDLAKQILEDRESGEGLNPS